MLYITRKNTTNIGPNVPRVFSIMSTPLWPGMQIQGCSGSGASLFIEHFGKFTNSSPPDHHIIVSDRHNSRDIVAAGPTESIASFSVQDKRKMPLVWAIHLSRL